MLSWSPRRQAGVDAGDIEQDADDDQRCDYHNDNFRPAIDRRRHRDVVDEPHQDADHEQDADEVDQQADHRTYSLPLGLGLRFLGLDRLGGWLVSLPRRRAAMTGRGSLGADALTGITGLRARRLVRIDRLSWVTH